MNNLKKCLGVMVCALVLVSATAGVSNRVNTDPPNRMVATDPPNRMVATDPPNRAITVAKIINTDPPNAIITKSII